MRLAHLCLFAQHTKPQGDGVAEYVGDVAQGMAFESVWQV
jgi:hypothetical protein